MDATLGRVGVRAKKIDMRVAIGLLLMIAAILGGLSVLKSARSRVPVIVAAADVQPGEVITARDLRVSEVALSGSVEAVPASSMSTVVGKVAAEPLYDGKLLTRRALSSGPPVPPGYVAMSLSLRPERAAAGALRPGDQVMVVATRNPQRPDTSSTILFTKVPVVAAHHRSGGEGQIVIVTLRLRPEEARALAEARAAGEIDLLLLSGDSE